MSDLKTEEDIISLPHNSWYDPESDTISFSLGICTFSLEPVAFFAFADQVEDIAIALAQMTAIEETECPTCGTSEQLVNIKPIPDDEYH